MEDNSIKKNVVLNILYTIINILFPIITFPYVSRIILVERMGAVSFFTSVASYATMCGSLGISMHGIRAVAKVRDDKKKLSGVSYELEIINIFATLVVLALLIIAVPFVSKFQSEPLLLLINCFLVFSNAFGMNWFYSGLEQYAYITKRTILIKILSLVLLLCFVKTIDDYVLYAAIIAFSTVASNCINFLHARKFINRPMLDHLEFKKHIKPMLLIFSSILAVSVYTNLDTVMLGFISGNREVGLYTVAVKSKTLLLTMVNAISTVLLPRLSYYFSNRMEKEYNRTVKKSISIIFMISVPLTLFFILDAYDCIVILGGKEYLDATLCMQIIMPILLISGFSNITGNQVLIPHGQDSYFMRAVTAGAIVDLVLNIFMIPSFGSIGAAVATLLAEITQMSIQFNYSKKCILPNIQWRTIAKIIASASIAGVIVYGAGNFISFNALIRIILLATIYFGIYGLSLILMKEKLFLDILQELASKVIKRM